MATSGASVPAADGPEMNQPVGVPEGTTPAEARAGGYGRAGDRVDTAASSGHAASRNAEPVAKRWRNA